MENSVTVILDNIINNYNIIKNKVGNSVEIAPTLKAEGYGVGSSIVAEYLPCESVFVFNTAEAIKIRKKRIYVLCPDFPNEIKYFKKSKMIPILETFQQLQIAIKENIKFGLFFNTGMNRNGFSKNDIKLIKENSKNLVIIITHMGYADNPSHPMSLKQIKNFNEIIKEFPDKNIIKSAFAIDGAMNYNDCYDLVRPGIGAIECNEIFKGGILVKSYVKSVKDNIAKVAFGITNGLPETYYSEGAFVKINGKKYKIKKVYSTFCKIESDEKIKVGDEVIIVDENFGLKEMSNKTFFNGINMLQREIVYRFAMCKKNIQYYSFKNKLVKREISHKSYKTAKVFFKKDRIETSVFDIIKVDEDGFVGYGATAKVKKGDVLAVLYGGYCDGISRYLSNCGYFYINGYKCKIIGRISMDQTVVLLDKNNLVYIGTKAYILKTEIMEILKGISEKYVFYCATCSKRVKKTN